MGYEKDKLIQEQSKTNHLDCCSKCGKVLSTGNEREMLVCESCFEYQVNKD